MVTSSEKLDYSGGDYDDFHLSTPPPDHSKYTCLTAKERAKMFGPWELSAQPSSSSPSEI